MSADMLGFFCFWPIRDYPRIFPVFARISPKTEMDFRHFRFGKRHRISRERLPRNYFWCALGFVIGWRLLTDNDDGASTEALS